VTFLVVAAWYEGYFVNGLPVLTFNFNTPALDGWYVVPFVSLPPYTELDSTQIRV
jgi:hypothetical protein